MALTEKLTAIGNAIREKNGTTAKMTLAEMPSAIANIRTAPEAIEETVTTYTQMNDKVTAYLSDTSSYTDDNYASVSVASNYKDSSQTTWEKPNGKSISPHTGTIHFTDEESGKGWHDAVTGASYTVYNLEPDKWYSYIIRNSSGSIVDTGRIKGTGKVRMINVPNSVHNFRDIGGWNADGGTVKYGMIYRGAQLSYYSSGQDKVYPLIDSTGIKYLRDICGIKSEIDMRTDAQVTGITSSVLGDDVEYVHYPYSDASYYAIVNPSGNYASQTKELIELAMNNVIKGVVTYVHCQAGADRTGVVCFVLESLLGVSKADCDRDYELTTFYYQGAYQRTRNSGASGGWIELRKYFDGLEGDTLQDKAMSWCKLIGISKTLVNKYRKAMIKGTPKDLSYNNSVAIAMYMDGAKAQSQDTTAVNGEKYVFNAGTQMQQLIAMGYSFSHIKVTMGGKDITSDVFDYNTYTVTIPNVTGDVTIDGYVISSAKSVTYILTNVTSSNNDAYVAKGKAYSAALSTGKYTMKSVKVTMDGTDITSSAYNSSTHVINITSVTGDIVITAVAELVLVNQIPISTDTDGSIFKGTGTWADHRMNSDGSVGAMSGYTCTGFIPVKSGQTISFENFDLPANSTGISKLGSNSNWKMHFYDTNHTRISMSQYQPQDVYAELGGTQTDGIIKTLNANASKIPNVAYMRIGAATSAFKSNSAIYVS